MKDNNSLSHTTWNCKYYIVFAPKYRRQVIYGKLKQDIGKALRMLCKRKGLKKMWFHDLRHSCASLLIANGVDMKKSQEWLGHSNFSTTANIYAHLDYVAKLSSAEAMIDALPLPDNTFESKLQNG